MDFRKISVVNTASKFIAGVIAIIMAMNGAGVWSLVFFTITPIVISTPVFWIISSWRPRFVWDKTIFKEVTNFGLATTGTSLSNYFIGNADTILIGYFVSTHMLGVYSFAFLITDIFRSKLMNVVNVVMYPVYGKIQDDLRSLKAKYLKVVSYNAIVIYPIMTVLIIYTKDILNYFYGSKWDESVIAVQLLALSVMIHMLVNSNTTLIRGMGKPMLEFKLQLLKSIIFVITIFIGVYYGGIVGVSCAVVANKVIAVLIAQYTFTRKLHIKITASDWAKAIYAPVSGILIAVFANYVFLYFLIVIHQDSFPVHPIFYSRIAGIAQPRPKLH